MQPPHVRITVTSDIAAGGDLVTEVGGSLPANPNVVPWPEPSMVRNHVSNLLGWPPNALWFCAPFPGADVALSTTSVVGA